MHDARRADRRPTTPSLPESIGPISGDSNLPDWLFGSREKRPRARRIRSPHRLTTSSLPDRLLRSPEKSTYLIDCSDLRRQAPVDAKHLVVHQRREVEVVEDVDAVLPRVGIPVLAHALLVKPVHL